MAADSPSGMPAERHSLIGTLISFLLLLGLLPRWARLRWTSSNGWQLPLD